MSFSGQKFGRVCKLSIETAPDATGKPQHITIPNDGSPQDEITIEFTISRAGWLGSQGGQFRIYGLRPATRDAIYKDQYDWSQFRAIQFFAGYQTFMPRIFNGTVNYAYSEREGEETVTVIDAFDGGFPMTTAWTNVPTNAGGAVSKTASTVIDELASAMPGILGPPVVGNFPVANQRGEVLFGNTWGLIREKSNGNCAISDGVVYALNLNEGLIGGEVNVITDVDPRVQNVPVINAKTGLLGAPRRSGTMVEWDMTFEPRLFLFQIISIESIFNHQYNGLYKVMGLEHRGIVSKSRTGDYTTTGKFFFGKGNVFAGALADLLGV